VGDCFAIAIVRCSGPAVLLPGGLELCKTDLKGQRRGCQRALVWQVSETDGHIFFGDLPDRPALSLFDVCRHPRLASVLFPVMVAAARHHEQHAKDFAASKFLETKVFCEELSRTWEVLKHLERLSKNLQQSSFSLLPLHLVFTDLTEWTDGQDLCQSCKKGSLLGDMLQHLCSCGLVSFKVYRRGQQRVTPSIPAQYWGGICVHMLNERCMQRFFTGVVLFEASGVTIADPGHCTSILLADNNLSNMLDTRIVRNQLCFVVNENVLNAVLTKHASGYHLEQSRTEMSEANFTASRQSCIEAFPWPAINGSGEFHLSKSFADVDFKCFQLAGPVLCRGSVRVIVGDYVGSEAYAIAALKKNKDRLPPPAACGLISAHSSASMTAGPNFNFLQRLTSSEVDVILAADGIQCTVDQAKFINVIGASLNAFFPVKAAPGSSTTALAEGIVGASIPKLKEHQKIIWLLKTRQQRDKQLKRLRNARGTSVQVAVVGRAAVDNKDDEENNLFLGSALQLQVNQNLLPFDEILQDSRTQLSAYTGPADVTHT
jgi:hypothetical protein